MDQAPAPTPAAPSQLDRMHHLLQIKAQMEEIHAQLEYLRLMLRLAARAR